MKLLRRCLILLCGGLLHAQSPTTNEESQLTVVQVGENEYEVGSVRLNKSQRTLSFPARVEIRDGDLEYAVVHVTGKTHETLLATEVEPQQIHIAALLLDAVGQSPTISVSWKADTGEVSFDLAELIQIVGVPTDLLTSEKWTYNGSEFQNGTFAAQSEGSIIALMPDTTALVNHVASMRINRDDIFKSKTSVLPPDQTAVEVRLKFPAIN
tara:strand:- start:22 stop:654 length:633 start_codon:yes stop_codon:yes gene_type:complete